MQAWSVLASSKAQHCERERFLEANKKCVTQSDLRSAACRLPAGAGVGTVAEMVVEGLSRPALLRRRRQTLIVPPSPGEARQADAGRGGRLDARRGGCHGRRAAAHALPP